MEAPPAASAEWDAKGRKLSVPAGDAGDIRRNAFARSRGWGRVDRTDLSILAELGRDQIMGFGSFDPRLSINEVAQRLGMPRSTVQARVRAWEEGGFLLGFDVWPSPDLFDLQMGLVILSVEDPRDRPKAIESVLLSDGTMLLWDMVGPRMGAVVLGPDEATVRRRGELLGRLSGVTGAEVTQTFRAPPADLEPTQLDWRIIASLREDPLGPLHEAADRVGVSTRTVTRRYQAMRDANAVALVPDLDFTRWEGEPLVRFDVWCDPDADRRAVAEEVARVLPEPEFIHQSLERIPHHPTPLLELLFMPPSLGRVEDAHREVLSIPGVEGVIVLFPRRFHLARHWCDALIAKHLPGDGGGREDEA